MKMSQIIFFFTPFFCCCLFYYYYYNNQIGAKGPQGWKSVLIAPGRRRRRRKKKRLSLLESTWVDKSPYKLRIEYTDNLFSNHLLLSRLPFVQRGIKKKKKKKVFKVTKTLNLKYHGRIVLFIHTKDRIKVLNSNRFLY